MFNLEKLERSILVFLAASLLLALAFTAYKKSHHPAVIRVGRFEMPDKAGEFADAAFPAHGRRININEAGIEDLMKIKGVGKVLAGRIIEYRSSAGSFACADDIKKVKGIGPGLFEKIKDDIYAE